ncbi:hypothetical protein [Cytobacillus massiliigabonensis]|uniref:hypothetical protein n=1 Tax=Cytobacillus massiliigabonensis TaxID=1871011 RepID=UPI000C8658DE|nr:hypothetical protein [Cytobacillus massiliigabonensis]
MSLYQKEKRKIIICLLVGLFFDIVFVIKIIEEPSTDLSYFFTWFGIYTLIACTLYPLGFVYVWKKMMKSELNSHKFDKNLPYTFREQRDGWAFSFAVTIFLMFSFGWILGPFFAYSRLKDIKMYEQC